MIMPTHYKGAAQQVRALNAYIPLMRASNTLSARSAAQLEPFGLTLGQFGALEALLHLGPMCQRELGRKLLCSPGNLTLVVDNLEKRGCVRRERQTDDRRMIRLYLTPRGRHLISKVFGEHLAFLVSEMSRLKASEQEELRCLCRKLGKSGQ